jgi:hypothetical protein
MEGVAGDGGSSFEYEFLKGAVGIILKREVVGGGGLCRL